MVMNPRATVVASTVGNGMTITSIRQIGDTLVGNGIIAVLTDVHCTSAHPTPTSLKVHGAG